MSDTYYAIKRRERQRAKANVAQEKRLANAKNVTPEAPKVDYRALQAQAKELDIPANQSADDLAAAIEKAQEG